MKLVLVPIEEDLSKQIEIHVVRELPQSEAFHAFLVIMDQLIQVQYYILAKATYTAAEIMDAYCQKIWRLYSLHRHITLDRN